MSSDVSVVYANALFSLVQEKGDAVLQETREDLRQCAVFFTLYPDLTRLLSLPTLSVEERQHIAEKIFGTQGYICRLLDLLIDHNRIRFIGEISDDFDARMMTYQNTIQVTVTTAVTMLPDQKERLREALRKKLGKTITIIEHIDRSILGGVIVQYGDTRIDNSLKYRLDTLKTRLG